MSNKKSKSKSKSDYPRNKHEMLVKGNHKLTQQDLACMMMGRLGWECVDDVYGECPLFHLEHQNCLVHAFDERFIPASFRRDDE